jgi:hypothetical protein
MRVVRRGRSRFPYSPHFVDALRLSESKGEEPSKKEQKGLIIELNSEHSLLTRLVDREAGAGVARNIEPIHGSLKGPPPPLPFH